MTREEAILILNTSLDCDKGKSKMFMFPMQLYITAQEMAIEALKEERPHGEWAYTTHFGSRFRICSVCKAEKEDDHASGWNFCQYCGADMRVKDELNRVNKELNSEIVKSKSKIVPDYRDGWRLKEGEAE